MMTVATTDHDISAAASANDSPQTPTERPVRVLVVHYEPELTESLCLALTCQGWDVRDAADAETAISIAREFRPDLAVMDATLPDMDGLEALRRLRTHSERLPVLFLALRDGLEERIAGLARGGDDFATRPFSVTDLVTRLHALRDRSNARGPERASVISVGDLALDEESQTVSRAGHDISLTATEFELLRFLMHNRGRVLSKAQILDRVWDYDFGGHANIVELYISYLRKKIDAGLPAMIHTVRGFGYVLRPAAA